MKNPVSNNFKTSGKMYAVLAVLAAWGLFSGYFRVFGFFAPYDDEGNLMLSVRDFVSGRILYDEVYSPYGPAYYLYKRAFFVLTGLSVTHDVTRLTTLAVWVSIAVCCAVFTYRISYSRLFSGISFVLTYVVLARTVHEPGLPQDICGLIEIVCLILLATTRHKTLKYCLVAGLIGFLLLIKVNLGTFFGLAILVAIVTETVGRLFRVMQGVVILGALVLPLVLFGKFLDLGWLRLYLAIAAGFIGLVIADLRYSSVNRDFPKASYFQMAGVFGTTVIAIILVTLAFGTSSSGLLYGVILQNLKMGADFVQPFPSWWFTSLWAIFAIFTAIIFYILKLRSPEIARHAAASLRIGFGASVIICSLAGYRYFLNEMLLINFATPFLWILLIEAKSKLTSSRFARIAIVAAALLLTLQVFPIVGTQRAYGTVLMVVIGVISLNDGFNDLDGLSSWFSDLRSRFSPAASYVISAALVCFCVFYSWEGVSKYSSLTPLDLPGATRVRLPESDVATFRSLVTKIASNCDNFITMPGLDSLYFWTGQNSPTTLNATSWVSMLNDSQQRSIISSFESLPRRCVVYHQQLTLNGSRNRDISQSPLAAYIFNNFTTVSTAGEYQFMLSNDRVQ